jgi:hypothetical protein
MPAERDASSRRIDRQRSRNRPCKRSDIGASASGMPGDGFCALLSMRRVATRVERFIDGDPSVVDEPPTTPGVVYRSPATGFFDKPW